MGVRRESEPTAVAWLQAYLGREIERLRDRAGLTRDQLAGLTAVSYKHLHAIESATRVPSHDFIQVADDLLNAQGSLASLRKELAEARMTRWFRKYLELEAIATRIHHYQVQVIPGLLQTPDYARALFDVVPTYRPREWVDEHIDTRIKRQHILTRQRPPEACFVLDEAALRRLPKEPAVTREQLRHILKMCELPNLTVQIVPFSRGMHAMLDGSMTLLGFDEGDDCVYVEPVGSGMVYSDAVGVASARRRYDALRAEGLPPAETAQMIISMMESL